jgi:hypothetical protein
MLEENCAKRCPCCYGKIKIKIIIILNWGTLIF